MGSVDHTVPSRIINICVALCWGVLKTVGVGLDVGSATVEGSKIPIYLFLVDDESEMRVLKK